MKLKDDLYYVNQVLDGNVEAYAYLVNRHKDHTFNLALRLCGNYEEAEEVAQDAFLKAYRSLSKFKMKSSFSTWLFRIVYNTAISHLRTRKAGILKLEDFQAEPSGFTGYVSEQEDDYRKSLVNFALKKLIEDERTLITLFYYEDLSIEEIAEITGLSTSNVRIRLFRARKKMHDIIRKAEMKNLIYL